MLSTLTYVNGLLYRHTVPILCVAVMEQSGPIRVDIVQFADLSDCECNWEVLSSCQNAIKALISHSLSTAMQPIPIVYNNVKL